MLLLSHYAKNHLAREDYNALQRKNVSAPCNTLRRLRNRIFHQEAICWDLYYLTCLHDNLIIVLGWMNADMPAWLESIDPFNQVCSDIRNEMGWK